jgi:hypothetical protein
VAGMGKEIKDDGAKDPEGDADTPSSMPKEQQGRGRKKALHDLEGQQGGTEGGGHESN